MPDTITTKPSLIASFQDNTSGAITAQAARNLIVSVPVLDPVSTSDNTIQPTAASVVPLVLQGAVSQTADLFECQNSSSGVLLKIDYEGTLSLASVVASTAITLGGNNVETQNNKNAASGYAGLNSSGNLVANIILRQDTDANMSSVVLSQGQPGYGQTSGKFAVGDNSTAFSAIGGFNGEGNVFTIQANGLQISNANTSTRARGTGAVDLQTNQTADAGEVASGANSFAAGEQSRASAQNSIAMGYQCNADGNFAVAIGDGANASANGTYCFGSGGTGGIANNATTNYAANLGGLHTRNNGVLGTCLGGYLNTIGNPALTFSVISGSSCSIASTNAVFQLTDSISGTTASVCTYNLTGGTNDAVFAAPLSLTSVSYSSPNTTFTIASGNIDDRTSGNIAPLDTAMTNTTNLAHGFGNATQPGTLATIIGGVGNSALGACAVHHGYYGQSYMPNQHVHSTNYNNGSTLGAFQGTDFVLVGESTTNTGIVLSLDGHSLGYSKQIGINNYWAVPLNATVSYKVLITARTSGGSSGNASWIYQVMAVNTNSISGTSVYSQIVGSQLNDGGGSASAWTVGFTADNSNPLYSGAVICTCTGSTSTNIHWTAYVKSAEVIF